MSKIKKIPRQLALPVLTFGASLILGLLSFSGTLALYPVLPLALAAMVLSVAYEGEIYRQNIKGALDKLFKHQSTQRQLATGYLLEHFPNHQEEQCPQFFKDYAAQLELLSELEDKPLNAADRVKKHRAQKNLRHMEKWFARQLFSEEPTQASSLPYQDEVRHWLNQQQGKAARPLWVAQLQQREKAYQAVKAFSGLAGVFMGLGSTYLLVEAFSTIPFFAAATWPLLIVPMALVAGSAYGLLTYNAMTDMIANNTLKMWVNKLHGNFKQEGFSARNVFMLLSAITLLGLAIALTVCTAGTWWTIAKEGRPLFAWMGRMPSVVMGVINPTITGLSAVVFNLENTSESLQMIDDATQAKGNPLTRLWHTLQSKVQSSFSDLRAKENWLQLLNPMRLLLAVTLLPLRVVLFLGHLISIGVTADRVPGLSSKTSATLGVISEGFEDAHYFINPDAEAPASDDFKSKLSARLEHEHHSHEQDIPTRFLNIVLLPLHFLAASWDKIASHINSGQRPQLTWSDALNKQLGNEQELKDSIPVSSEQNPSSGWRTAQALLKIERHEEKHLHNACLGQETAREQMASLRTLKDELIAQSEKDCAATIISQHLKQHQATYSKHRFFNHGKTAECHLLEDKLPQLVTMIA